jgi:hypothetical protein
MKPVLVKCRPCTVPEDQPFAVTKEERHYLPTNVEDLRICLTHLCIGGNGFDDDCRSGPARFGVLVDDPVGEAINRLTGKTVQDRTISVSQDKKIGEVKVCQVLFVGTSKEELTREIIATVNGVVVLRVDGEEIARRSTVINFILNGNKATFEINGEAIIRSKQGIIAQLIKLARPVY